MFARRNAIHVSLIVLVFGMVIILNVLATSHQAAAPWVYIESDHENLGPMHYKNIDPSLFSRDYFFNDNRYFAYYTPSFLGFLALASSLGLDYFQALAALQGPVLLLYLTGAYALFWQISTSRTIALVFALLSINGVRVLTDFWYVTGFVSMLPRTMALPGVVWSAFLLMRFLKPVTRGSLDGSAWWHWIVLGILLGLTANLHPLTGLAFSMIAGITLLASWKRTRKPAFHYLITLIFVTVLTALPIVLNVTGRSSRTVQVTSADFHTFAAGFQGYYNAMLPAPIGHLSNFSNQEQIAIALFWLPLTLIPWWLAKPNQRSVAALVFVIAQLAYVWLLIKNLDESVDYLMIIVVGLFFIWRWWVKDEQQEMIFYEMMAAVTCVSFFLLILLRLIWLNFEIWPLTTVVSGLARGARLHTVPFYLIGARLAVHIATHVKRRDLLWLIFIGILSLLVPLSPWHGFLALLLLFADRISQWRVKTLENFALWAGSVAAVSVYVVYQIVTRHDANLPALIVGIMVAFSTYVLMRLNVDEPKRWVILLIGFAAAIVPLTVFDIVSPLHFTNDSPWYVQALRGAPDFITFLLGSTLALGLWLLFGQPWRPHSASPSTASALFSLLRQPFILTSIALLAIITIQTMGLMTISLRRQPQDMPAIVAAAEWARQNTDENALFFDSFDAGTRFRLWSLRSITHGWKELGLLPFARPIDLAPMIDRHEQIVAASHDPDDVVAAARDLGADYIIRGHNSPLDLPVVYTNDELDIYRLAE